MFHKISKDLTTFLLQDVRQRPGMYLMDRNLVSLVKFITGYRFGFINTETGRKDRFIEFFDDWFQKKKNIPSSEIWYVSILEECNNSGEKALERFWQYLNEFSKQVKEV